MKKHFTGQSDINHLNAPGLKVRFTERMPMVVSLRTLFLLTISFLALNFTQAQILGWEFQGNTGSEVFVDATTKDDNLQSSIIFRGSGIQATGLGNAFNSNNFQSPTLQHAIDNDKYLEFAIAANNGYTVSLSTLDANFRRSGTGPQWFQWQYSLDGFTTSGIDIGAAVNYTGSGTNGNSQAQIVLSGIPALQNVTAPTEITIRLYAWDNTNAGGTFALGRLSGDDLAIGGTVEPAGGPILIVSSLSEEFGNVCLGETVGPETFTVEGDELDGTKIEVGPLTGFEFSLDDITYSSTVDITYTAPTLASTTVYVKFSPTIEQNYADDIPVTGGDADPEACTLTDAAGVDSAPSVTTGSASSIGIEDATCAGTIDDEGCDVVTAYGIEYSTTEDFTPGTGTQVAGSNLNDGDYDVELTGLDEGTTYYYRAYATSSKGTSYGEQDSFTTDEDDGSLPAPVATEASDVTQTSFQANWNTVSGASCYYLDVFTLAGATDDVVFWDFTDGDQQADGGGNGNDQVEITSTGTIGTYTYPGTGNNKAISTTGWDDGADTKYWEIVINTEGYFDLSLSSLQQSSGTGPKDFKVQYMIENSGNWIDIPNGNITVANNRSTGKLDNLPLPEECSDQSELHIRWIMTSNTSVNNGIVASGGTNRQDDIYVRGYEATFVVDNQSECGTEYEVTGLDDETTYFYRVRATDGTETSGNSNIIEVSTPLPLTMLNFEVTRNSTARTAILKWSTAEEVNSSHFDVLKSTDGFRWEKIGEVKTNGNLRSINSYSFVDRNPAKMNYYRLNSIDYDGYSALSEIRSAAFDGSLSTTFYPNPASSYLMVHTESSYNKYSIINALGVTETSGVLNGTETRVDISQLASGIYFLKINNEVQRFVKN